MRYAVLLLPLIASGCGAGDWFGKEVAPPLPGERVAVLAYDPGARVDAEIAAVPVVVPPPALNIDWPVAGGRIDHSGGAFMAPAEPQRQWREDVGDGTDRDRPIIPGPVASGGLIFSMDSGATVTATMADSGKRAWKVDLSPPKERGEGTGGGVAVVDSVVYAATGFGDVVALEAATGKELWRHRLMAPVRSAPSVAGGMVYVVTIDNQLVALAAATGDVRWEHSGIVEEAGLLGAPSPAASNGVVVVAYSSGELFALRGENGRVIWSDSLAPARREGGVMSIAAIRGQPVIAPDGSLVLAISNSGRLVAIDTRSGQRAWEQRISGNQTPWIAGDFVYVLSNTGQLMALTLREGRVRWVRQLETFRKPKSKEGPIVWAGPMLAGDKLWLTNSEGQLRGFSPSDGSDALTRKIGASTLRAPMVLNGSLYVLDDDATLSAWR